ncbi:MAG: choice-of-anchor J domain-containing protein [Flavobacterium sp.]|nr:choice-of-anchor J domain-containing protein [Flavobacterium sp.]
MQTDWTNSGALDLSTINSNSVYIAFKYIGSKSQGKTTTFQLDNIKIYENK